MEHRNIVLGTLVFGCMTTVLAGTPMTNRYGGYGPDVLCVYPVDGQYTFLQRLLFYVLLVFGVLARRKKWLVVGALTTAMSYSGAAAIHAMLLVTRDHSYIDLNIFGIFAITSAGVMLSVLLFRWSTTLGKAGRRLRYIVILWLLLLLVGSVFAVGIMYARQTYAAAPACLDPETVDSSVASLFPSDTENCTYVCFHQSGRLFHSPDQIIAWPNKIHQASDITSIYFPTAISYLGAFIVFTIIFRVRQRKQRGIHSRNRTPTPLSSSTSNSPTTDIWLREKVPGRQTTSSETVLSSPPPSESSRPRLWTAVTYFSFFALFGAVIANAVNEYRMYPYPTNESSMEVGQWAPWVAVGLVVLAQLINKYAKMRWEGKGADDEESGFDRIRRDVDASMIRRGWIVPRQPIMGTGIDSDISRAETWESRRRYSF